MNKTEFLDRVALEIPKVLHYPECWDLQVYPTIWDAALEVLSWSGCINPECSRREEVEE